MPSQQLKTFDHDKVVSISGRKLSPAPVGADMNLEERRAALRKWLVREACRRGQVERRHRASFGYPHL